MKNILLLLLLICFIGCSNENVVENETVTKIRGTQIKVFVIDGCQYIGTVWGANNDFLTHKGNCNSPFHSDNHWVVDTSTLRYFVPKK